jgi:hypothetical protein
VFVRSTTSARDPDRPRSRGPSSPIALRPPAQLAPLIGNRAFARLARERRVARTKLKTADDELDTTQPDFGARIEAIAEDVANGLARVRNLRAAAQEHCSKTDEHDKRALELLEGVERQLVWERGSDPRGSREQSSLASFPKPPFAVGNVLSGTPLRAYRFVEWIVNQHDQAITASQVAKAVHVQTGREVAIKIYDKQYLGPTEEWVAKPKPAVQAAPVSKQSDENDMPEEETDWEPVLVPNGDILNMRREVEHHRRVGSAPGVLPLIEVIEDRFNLYIVTPLARGGDVERAIAKRSDKRLPEAEAGLVFRQMVEALAATHAAGIAHLDVKARNIVLPESGAQHARLMDFGGSRTVAGLTKYPYYGTEGYMAPEVEAKGPLRQPSDLFKADVYSLAVTMVEMLTGRSTAHVPSGIDPALADLLRSMLSRHPGERPDTAAIKKHRWWAGAAAVAH